MDKYTFELLRDIDLQIEQNKVNEWNIVKNIFTNAIKKKGLSVDQVNEINKKILKEIEKGNNIDKGSRE
ncbi:hypothetical protein [Clostridium saccharobutylicum]|uniref:Uncharacterized protein n=1 Tax=Clostridium saccharobutylicum DSM 13864 TaxID=1345695 RepID=U5MVT3_CLOSA|nr:hypothetical protein [Clostridium saccharobutylicum]AGX43547.1 hypothetical protein CLSA_c25760 [Clostridium saccharobutylicum DSM 13864]AQR90845.1 hypothetical protein CLOSC_25660 [Clostridium saccharobutylicum]AQS00749.1 hypothetical protein CSACC_25730 [Clostridium saccharobutylicum]AQS10411.1 hypothetical protein CLOBY_25540 [Clostridium saccharobutylicum]AQS14732.1 hypothetical protein CLOSACC_25730 [Clostridium saccharobutylicum]